VQGEEFEHQFNGKKTVVSPVGHKIEQVYK